MGIFERYLSIWVFLSIVGGIALGALWPDIFAALAQWEWAGVNLVVAILIWLMIYPMMLKVDPACFRNVGKNPKGLMLTLIVNWLIKPFTMTALAFFFFDFLLAGFIPSADAQSYIAGMILLGIAPCTAMVFIWSHLTTGDPNYTLLQVSVNDIILVFAFGPLAGLLLGITDIEIPWQTLFTSVFTFVVLPLAAGLLTRQYFMKKQDISAIDSLPKGLKPFSILSLLLTVILLFGFQAEMILKAPLRVLLIALPLLIQSYAIFAITYLAARALKLPFNIAAPAAMIGTSNFFELAVAVAISLFGLGSGAALATVVGVLIEVPVMLSLVALANRTQGYFQYTADPNTKRVGAA